MKKLLLLAVAVFAINQLSQAQTEKGSQTFGFNLGYTYNNNNQTEVNTFDTTTSIARSKITDFTFGPAYSYFIADNLDLGASLQLSDDIENDYPINGQFGEKDINRSFGASIFIRKYILHAGKIGIRTGPYLSYTRYEQTTTATGDSPDASNDLDTKTHDFDAGINLDLVYFPSKKLGFAATIANLEYSHFTSHDTPTGDHETGDTVNFNVINSGLELSVFFVFGGK